MISVTTAYCGLSATSSFQSHFPEHTDMRSSHETTPEFYLIHHNVRIFCVYNSVSTILKGLKLADFFVQEASSRFNAGH